MSSTYVHYSAPSSLPSDYALLSRYAAARHLDTNETNSEDEAIEESEESEDLGEGVSRLAIPPSPHIARRSSFPTSYIQPPPPTVKSLPPHSLSQQAAQNEYTPLLVPRIEEEETADVVNGQVLGASWEELRILLKYTLPVFGTHVLEYSFVIASVISIGHLSTTALAASTLGSMTASVTGLSIIQGFASTLDTMLPGAWTSTHPQLVGLWSQRMTVVMAIILIPIFAIWFNSEALLILLRQDADVAHLAGVYLKYISIGLPAYTFNAISRRYFQSQGLFAVPTRVIMAVAPINALLNYLFVWGPKPFGFGFIGAPLATAISFNLVSIASVIYGVWFVPRTAWHPITRRSFTSLGVLIPLGLAGVGQTASEWWSWELIGLAASLLGPNALATQSVLLVSASTTFQAPFALSIATSVRIGNLLGEENAARAAVATKMSLILALAFAGVSSFIFFVFRKSWGYIFNDDPSKGTDSIHTRSARFRFSHVALVDGLSAVTGGIFRARGKQARPLSIPVASTLTLMMPVLVLMLRPQFTGALLNLSAYYVIGIPFGMWLTFKHNMGLHGLWLGLTVSLVYSAVIGVYLCLSTDWNHEVKKVHNRLARDKQHQHQHCRLDVEQPAGR
ncbi:hypothetical protein EVG20_g6409 [Dentipellis fragilis]|uniref:MATE efflux family protein n=1 Tax=Dentipellis fragilis TaxID=205917 RepID=A0A4Y9YN32_9AGAM|nr:hypothetical protein EVG20_g6409 [Dentipellis fragilis]